MKFVVCVGVFWQLQSISSMRCSTKCALLRQSGAASTGTEASSGLYPLQPVVLMAPQSAESQLLVAPQSAERHCAAVTLQLSLCNHVMLPPSGLSSRTRNDNCTRNAEGHRDTNWWHPLGVVTTMRGSLSFLWKSGKLLRHGRETRSSAPSPDRGTLAAPSSRSVQALQQSHIVAPSPRTRNGPRRAAFALCPGRVACRLRGGASHRRLG